MHRRTFFASLGTSVSALSGCLNVGTNSGTPPSTDDSCTMPEPRRVSISDTSAVPESGGIAIDTSLDRARITSQDTARLTITMHNTGDTRYTNRADKEYCHLFHRSRGQSTPTGLWLHRQQNAPDHDETCWQQSTSPEETRTYVSIGCARAEFSNGASIGTTYEVWDDYVTDDFFSPTTYRFDTTIPLWTTREDDHPTRIDWWFELTVTNPSS